MRISQLFPSKYVRTADLNGKPVTLTIKSLVVEELGHGAEAERKPCLYFEKATKALVLNATNARTIAALYGDEANEWRGKRITLYATRIRAFGSVHDVIRVKEEAPPPPAAATQAAQEEAASEMEDSEDIIDTDEGHEPRWIDSATGEIISVTSTPTGETNDAMWEPDVPMQAKPPVLSPAQLTRITVLGADVYGAEWEDNSDKLAQWASQGARSHLADLLPGEAAALIKALEKRLKKKPEKAAAQPQPEPEPQPHV